MKVDLLDAPRDIGVRATELREPLLIPPERNPDEEVGYCKGVPQCADSHTRRQHFMVHDVEFQILEDAMQNLGREDIVDGGCLGLICDNLLAACREAAKPLQQTVESTI